MKSDTIIGIVGSILLVGVIVGVFIYEYNNVEPQDEDEIARAAFARGSFSHLAADEDIDGDGTANYLDADIDGDGISNSKDTDGTKVTIPFSGTIAAGRTGEVGQHSTTVFKGATIMEVAVTTPNAPGSQATPYTTTVFLGETSLGSGTGPFSFPGQQGDLRVSIAADTISLGGSYNGSITLTY